jgi:hypothetical protein
MHAVTHQPSHAQSELNQMFGPDFQLSFRLDAGETLDGRPSYHKLVCVLAVYWCHQRPLRSPSARDPERDDFLSVQPFLRMTVCLRLVFKH